VFLTFEDQWLSDETNGVFHYAKYDDPLLREYVKKAFEVTKMAGYAKFDVRLDQSGRYFFIDTNCNPAMGPKEADVAISLILDMYGVTFYEILRWLISSAMREACRKKQPIQPKLGEPV
jgi:D-alanine-D-alanine ligase-like ATP-grasp enzyme